MAGHHAALRSGRSGGTSRSGAPGAIGSDSDVIERFRGPLERATLTGMAPRGRVLPSALALGLAVALAACGGQGSPPETQGTLLNGDTVDPGVAERIVADFKDEDGPAQEQEAAHLDSAIERAAWTISGLEDAVGGAAQADALFADVNLSSRSQLATMVAPLGTVKAFGRSAPLRTDGLSEAGGAGLFGALMVASLSAGAAAGLPDGARTGSETNQGITLSATKTAGTVKTSSSTTVSGVELKIETSATVQPCPDASGVVVAEGSASASTHQGSTGHSFSYHAKVTLQVGDDAEIVSSTEELRSEQADYAGGRGHYVDVAVDSKGGYQVTRAAGELPANYVTQSVTGALLFGTMLSSRLSGAAEAVWKSGACVVLEPTVSAGPTGLEPGASVTITAAPRSKLDGAAVGGSVTAVLSGGQAAVDPSGTKVSAPATFTYTAPGKRAQTGDVTLEARSKRGVAKATLHFDTYDTSFQAEGGGGDFSGSGTICSLTRPFTISGTGLTLRFSPAGESGGKYVLSGRAAGVAWSGTGTYTVTLNASRNSGTLKTVGTNTIQTPRGAFSGQARASFALRSVTNCN